MLDGWINLDKPAGISSAAAVTRVKRLLPRGTRIGHAGTLDPFATGVLVVLVGKATRLCERFMSQPKRYEATVKLGATTETLDPTSPEIPCPGSRPVPRQNIEQVLPRFVGQIEQTPPLYSAMKIQGLRAYKVAREGGTPQIRPRTVQVYGIELLDYHWPLLSIRVDCGRGTYIRALARDIAESLGTSGYLLQLRRTRVGPAEIGQAVTIEQLAGEGVERHLHPSVSA